METAFAWVGVSGFAALTILLLLLSLDAYRERQHERRMIEQDRLRRDERDRRCKAEALLVKTGEERMLRAKDEADLRSARRLAGECQIDLEVARAELARIKQDDTEAVTAATETETNYRLLAMLAGSIWLSRTEGRCATLAKDKLARWNEVMEEDQ